MTPVLAVLFLQAAIVLENDHVRVSKDRSVCAASRLECGDRIIVALSDVELRSGSSQRTLTRGDIAVFAAGQSYEPPKGAFFEVVIKPNRPAAAASPELIPPEKNAVLYDGERFLVFEERLPVGETRARHSHNQRVVIQLNRTRLQQWPDGQPEIVRDIEPDRVAFNPPVIHIVKNVGDLPLRGIVIELKARRDQPPQR
jgi:hypothetical protein